MKVTKRQLRRLIKEQLEGRDESGWKDFRRGVPIAGTEMWRGGLMTVKELKQAIAQLSMTAGETGRPGADDTTIWITHGSEFRPIKAGDVQVSGPDETIKDAGDGNEYKPGTHVIIGGRG